MKDLLIALAFVLFLASPAFAEDWIVEPRYPLQSENSILSPGSYLNPYELRDQSGRTRGTIRSRYPDLIPNDGVLDRGGYANPYELKWD